MSIEDSIKRPEGTDMTPIEAAEAADTREQFEAYFIASRKSKGAGRAPNMDRWPDGTYADDHTQRHWWTWQSALRAALPALREVPADALADMEARKDAAYLERNRCVALIARMALALGCRAGVARTAIEGWSDDWHGCVYIELPTGQASWHFHDSQAHLFDGLPPYAGAWDGHDTPTKYERVAGAYAAPPAPPVREVEPVAWCALKKNGQIDYFEGKPMVMPGPVGNECHPVPLYAAPPTPAPAAPDEPGAGVVEALRVLRNFEFTGPDVDGLVWLVLHGHGTSGQAMFNLGSANRLAIQVALKLEEDRRAALAAQTDGRTE